MPEGHVFIAVSLDGYIAREDGGLDWLDLPGAAAEDHGYDDFMASMDGIVMGRRTYETVLGFGAWPYAKPVIVLGFGAWPYAKPVIVLSGGAARLPAPEGAKVYGAAAPDKAWAQAAARGWGRVHVDGGACIRAFLEAGRIAEITLSRLPVILGAGRPLFAPGGPTPPLRLLGARSFPSGIVQSRYAVG